MGPYRRPDSRYWQISWTDENGVQLFASTKSTDRGVAEALWRKLHVAASDKRRMGEGGRGPLLFGGYRKRWLDGRERDGYADDATWLKHATSLDRIPMREIRREDILGVVSRAKLAKLAPRSVHHIYATLRLLFDDALVAGLISATPCTLKVKRNELPKRSDQNPAWRATAVFERVELEGLISDERILLDRRVLNGLEGVAALRFGEASAATWGAYDAETEPLGRLRVVHSFNTRLGETKGVKTDNPRDVPVHPTLAKLLATWKLSGWQKMMGRKPEADDLIVPTRRGENRKANHSLRLFHADCEAIGIRPRRQHDLRRTFVSLALAGGARKDLLRWVTHGPEGDIIDQYNTPPWAALCEQVSCLRVRLRSGALLKVAR